MEEKEAKIRFNSGLLRGASVAKTPLENGWNPLVTDKNKKITLIEKKRGGTRVIKTLDATCNTAKEIIFNELAVRIR